MVGEVWLKKLPLYEPTTPYRHNGCEDNAEAHLSRRRQVMGREVVMAVTDGQLVFGPWEQIFNGEFEGGRKKRVRVKKESSARRPPDRCA